MAADKDRPHNRDDLIDATLDEAYACVVQRVVKDGPHGPYFVASTDRLDGSVTCSLDPEFWKGGEDWPEEGETVVLSKLRKKRAGWRAKQGRFFQPSDERNSTQHKATSNKN
jgi:hypothetical protein